jgi:hypothetical protein
VTAPAYRTGSFYSPSRASFVTNHEKGINLWLTKRKYCTLETTFRIRVHESDLSLRFQLFITKEHVQSYPNVLRDPGQTVDRRGLSWCDTRSVNGASALGLRAATFFPCSADTWPGICCCDAKEKERINLTNVLIHKLRVR